MPPRSRPALPVSPWASPIARTTGETPAARLTLAPRGLVVALLNPLFALPPLSRWFGPDELLSLDQLRRMAWDSPVPDPGAPAVPMALLTGVLRERLSAGRLVALALTPVEFDALGDQLLTIVRTIAPAPGATGHVPARVVSIDAGWSSPHPVVRGGYHAYTTDRLRARVLAAGWDAADVLAPGDVVEWEGIGTPRTAHGWDVIGDVHGCRATLEALLETLGYTVLRDRAGRPVRLVHPAGRCVGFAGDLVNRGPDSPGVLALAHAAVAAGGVAVAGNHDLSLAYDLVTPPAASPGRRTIDPTDAIVQLHEATSPDERASLADFLRLPSHVVVRADAGEDLVIAHAGIERWLVGRSHAWLAHRCAHGEPGWAPQHYERDDPTIDRPFAHAYGVGTGMRLVHGHWSIAFDGRTPPAPLWRGGAVNIDTACVRGGALTALQWPEGTTVSIPTRDGRA